MDNLTEKMIAVKDDRTVVHRAPYYVVLSFGNNRLYKGDQNVVVAYLKEDSAIIDAVAQGNKVIIVIDDKYIYAVIDDGDDYTFLNEDKLLAYGVRIAKTDTWKSADGRPEDDVWRETLRKALAFQYTFYSTGVYDTVEKRFVLVPEELSDSLNAEGFAEHTEMEQNLEEMIALKKEIDALQQKLSVLKDKVKTFFQKRDISYTELSSLTNGVVTAAAKNSYRPIEGEEERAKRLAESFGAIRYDWGKVYKKQSDNDPVIQLVDEGIVYRFYIPKSKELLQ